MISLKQSKRIIAKAKKRGSIINQKDALGNTRKILYQSHTGVIYDTWNKFTMPNWAGCLSAIGNYQHKNGGIGWDYSRFVPRVHHYSWRCSL